MFSHTIHKAKSLLAVLLICLTFLCITLDAQAQYQVGKIVDNDQKALVADINEPIAPIRPTGTVGTIDQTPTRTVLDVGTVTRDPVQLEDAGGITGATVVQIGTLTPLQVPESDLQRVFIPGLLDAVEYPNFIDVEVHGYEPDSPTLAVTQPVADDFWIAGASYPVRWNSTNLNDPVKIHMVHAVASDYVFYPVTYNTENDGAFDFTVPAMLGCNYKNFYLQVATLDEQLKAVSGPIEVYHEPADMTVKVVGLGQHTDVNPYVDYKLDEWLQFDVWVRNNGTQQSTTVQTIRVIVIKEPEEVVIDGGHEEFGFGNMAPRLWYSTPQPRKFSIFKSKFGNKKVNMQEGAYRVEVTVDPMNLLGEDPPMREDNHFVQRFEIR
ncbi:MAG: hypothetical protein QNK43_11355 [Amphritea sp.]|nr:hypothetical protein [Amphritea sp.]